MLETNEQTDQLPLMPHKQAPSEKRAGDAALFCFMKKWAVTTRLNGYALRAFSIWQSISNITLAAATAEIP
jgi:hypothetical protein